MKKLFIEKVTLDEKGDFLYSEPIPATEEQINEFKSKPCNHSTKVDKLIYDEWSWPYDARYCGVCDQIIGWL